MVMVKGSCTILKHNFSVSTVCLFKHTSVLTVHKPTHPRTMAASVVEYGCKTLDRTNVLTSFTCITVFTAIISVNLSFCDGYIFLP